MNDKTPKDSHYARLRRQYRDSKPGNKASGEKQWQRQQSARPFESGSPAPQGIVRLYGIHTVRHALENAERKKSKLFITANARDRLGLEDDVLAALPESLNVNESSPRELDRLVGSDAVHQGCVLEAEPLRPKTLAQISDSSLLLVLDQVTDPHNVGAIMRSAVAMGAGALITTARHSPVESGVLAKSASGALDMIDHIEARNLANALGELHKLGYQTIGLDSEGADILENSIIAKKNRTCDGCRGQRPSPENQGDLHNPCPYRYARANQITQRIKRGCAGALHCKQHIGVGQRNFYEPAAGRSKAYLTQVTMRIAFFS